MNPSRPHDRASAGRSIPSRPAHSTEPRKAPRVLLTGMSATGKSSVVEELGKRGVRAIDMDDPGHSYRDSAGNQVWREDVVEKALSNAGALPLFWSAYV